MRCFDSLTPPTSLHKVIATVGGTALTVSLLLSGCSSNPEKVVTSCYIQPVTFEDSTIYMSTKRGLRQTNDPKLDATIAVENKILSGLNDAVKASMGFVMNRDEPLNHSPNYGSYFGWCRTDEIRQKSSKTIFIEPLYTEYPELPLSTIQQREKYINNDRISGLLSSLTPGGYQIAVYPSDRRTPVKLPDWVEKAINTNTPNDPVEVPFKSIKVTGQDNTERSIQVLGGK